MKVSPLLFNRPLSLFREPERARHLLYAAGGLPLLLFKNISRIEIFLLFSLLLILNVYLVRTGVFFKKKARIPAALLDELKNLQWTFFPLVLYSLFLPERITGLLLIAGILSDRTARLVRARTAVLSVRYFVKNFKGTIAFFLSNLVLSLLFFYYLAGYIIIRDAFLILLVSVFLSLLESVRICRLPDNFNIAVFGPVLILLLTHVDFRFRFSMLNLVFGAFLCLFIILIFILFDLFELKSSWKNYIYFVLFYTGMGYFLFIFHVLILFLMGLAARSDRKNVFIPSSAIRAYFYLPAAVLFVYCFIPHILVVKTALVTGMITALTHYTGSRRIPDLLSSRLSGIPLFQRPAARLFPFLNRLGIRLPEQFLFNNTLSVLLLALAYALKLIHLPAALAAIILMNLTLALNARLADKYYPEEEWEKFLVTFIPFKTMLILNL